MLTHINAEILTSSCQDQPLLSLLSLVISKAKWQGGKDSKVALEEAVEVSVVEIVVASEVEIVVASEEVTVVVSVGAVVASVEAAEVLQEA